jgi:hypothetical protein
VRAVPAVVSVTDVPVVPHPDGGVEIYAPGTNVSGTRVSDQASANTLWAMVHGVPYPQAGFEFGRSNPPSPRRNSGWLKRRELLIGFLAAIAVACGGWAAYLGGTLVATTSPIWPGVLLIVLGAGIVVATIAVVGRVVKA